MTIVACPRCRDEVTVPARASRQALVRCPLCEEEYLLSEALADLPPALVVVGGEMEMEPEPALAAAGAATADGEYSLAGGGFGGVVDSSPGTGAVSVGSRPAVRGASRPRRKEKSPVGEILKVVVGGVVGLSMGLLVLWWGFRRDPLDLGPQISPYAPWIVPAEFRGKPTPATGNNATAVVRNNAATANNAPRRTTASDGSFQPHPNLTQGQQNTGGSAFGSADNTGGLQTLDPLGGGFGGTELPGDNPLAPASLDLPAQEPEPTTPEANPGSLPPEEAPAPSLEPTEEPAAPAAPKAKSKGKGKARPPGPATPEEPTEQTDFRNLLPGGEEPPGDTPNSTPVPPTPVPPTPVPPSVDSEPSAAPAATPEELQQAVGAASDALTKVDEGKGAPVEVRRQLFTDLYAALSDMGRVATQIDLSSADAAEGADVLKHLVGQLSAQAGPGTKMSAIGTLARGQIVERKAGDGIALAGAVTDFHAAGKVFECTLDLGSGTTATVVSLANPQDFCQIGDQVLIVGRIVEDPATNVAGYEGEATRVVLLGHAAAAK